MVYEHQIRRELARRIAQRSHEQFLLELMGGVISVCVRDLASTVVFSISCVSQSKPSEDLCHERQPCAEASNDACANPPCPLISSQCVAIHNRPSVNSLCSVEGFGHLRIKVSPLLIPYFFLSSFFWFFLFPSSTFSLYLCRPRGTLTTL